MILAKAIIKNYVKLISKTCEPAATNHKNNLQPSQKDNQNRKDFAIKDRKIQRQILKKAATNSTSAKIRTKVSKFILGHKNHVL